MQADGGLVQHEQRVHERRAGRGRQVDALDFAARERARLAIQRQIAQADVVQIVEARADLTEQQVRRFIERLRQLELLEERAGALQRQQHHVVDREAGQRARRLVAPLHAGAA